MLLICNCFHLILRYLLIFIIKDDCTVKSKNSGCESRPRAVSEKVILNLLYLKKNLTSYSHTLHGNQETDCL